MGLQGSPVRIRPSRFKPYNHSVVGLKSFLGPMSGRTDEPASALQKPGDLSYFQGHYLKSVEVEKRSESLDVVPGWFWIPTVQSRAHFISYVMEPESGDNIITCQQRGASA